jgi:hypothetical protein
MEMMVESPTLHPSRQSGEVHVAQAIKAARPALILWQ